MNPRGKCSENTAGIWSLFLAVVSISCYGEGEAVYCHINDYSIFQPARSIFESRLLALGADCCSHSCDYGHKNIEMLLCDEAAHVGSNTVTQR